MSRYQSKNLGVTELDFDKIRPDFAKIRWKYPKTEVVSLGSTNYSEFRIQLQFPAFPKCITTHSRDPDWKYSSRIPISFPERALLPNARKFFSGKSPNPGIPGTPYPSYDKFTLQFSSLWFFYRMDAILVILSFVILRNKNYASVPIPIFIHNLLTHCFISNPIMHGCVAEFQK